MTASGDERLPLKTERLDSKTVFRGEKLALRVDTLKMGDRSPATKEIIQHPGSSVMLPITDRGTVLLVKQWRAAQGCYTLELPSGTRDGDEPPEVTADRELRRGNGIPRVRIYIYRRLLSGVGLQRGVFARLRGDGLGIRPFAAG